SSGMRLMSDGGSHNVLQIDPWFIERVDVIRGPSTTAATSITCSSSGMRLMSDGGSHNVLQIDPWFIERVDVIRGPS
ncbi:hypothetical protein C0U44_31555, partial [Klebsiella pneumoniae]